MAVKIAVYNQKGGVGKTTAVKSLAGELSKQEFKVLVIDADSSGNTSTGLEHEVEPEVEYANLINAYCMDDSVSDPRVAIVPTLFPNLDLMPGGEKLDIASRNMDLKALQGFDSSTIMRELFYELDDDYDFILLDCPGHRNGTMTRNALAFADYVLIPMAVDVDSVNGYNQSIGTINSIRKISNPRLKLIGVYFAMVNDRRKLYKTMKEMKFEAFIDNPIPNLGEVPEATLEAKPMCYFRPRHRVTQEYHNLTNVILKRAGVINE
jgi:chromosome partitioning protein